MFPSIVDTPDRAINKTSIKKHNSFHLIPIETCMIVVTYYIFKRCIRIPITVSFSHAITNENIPYSLLLQTIIAAVYYYPKNNQFWQSLALKKKLSLLFRWCVRKKTKPQARRASNTMKSSFPPQSNSLITTMAPDPTASTRSPA